MSCITSRIGKVDVLKPLQKPWTISLAQRWIREDSDQSKLIKKYLFPNHHKTLKKSEREGGKALEKVTDRVVDESLENSRTNRCVNFMGLLF